MKRSQSSVPAAETGALPGDSKGSRAFMNMPTKGGRNATTNESRRAAGQVAPRPQNSKQPLLGASKDTAGTVASMARVPGAGSAGAHPNGSFLPVRKPPANLVNSTVGQSLPDTGAVSTAKPKRKGLGSAFFGEY